MCAYFEGLYEREAGQSDFTQRAEESSARY
jgi:hypothetical protein